MGAPCVQAESRAIPSLCLAGAYCETRRVFLGFINLELMNIYGVGLETLGFSQKTLGFRGARYIVNKVALSFLANLVESVREGTAADH